MIKKIRLKNNWANSITLKTSLPHSPIHISPPSIYQSFSIYQSAYPSCLTSSTYPSTVLPTSQLIHRSVHYSILLPANASLQVFIHSCYSITCQPMLKIKIHDNYFCTIKVRKIFNGSHALLTKIHRFPSKDSRRLSSFHTTCRKTSISPLLRNGAPFVLIEVINELWNDLHGICSQWTDMQVWLEMVIC